MPPIPFRDVSVALVHVVGCGLFPLKWVVLSARDWKFYPNRFSLSCTCAVRSTILSLAVFRAWYDLLKIPVDPDISGTDIRCKPKSQNHFHLEIRLALLDTPLRADDSSSLLICFRIRIKFAVSISQPRTVLVVLHLAPHLYNFLREIVSSLDLYWGLLGGKNFVNEAE